MRKLAVIAVTAVALGLAGCASTASSSSSAAPTPAARPAAATVKAAPSPSCTLKDTPTYIVRDDDPGASILASDIGNADYENCTTMLSNFAATAGQASGECATVALASDNPGYDVNAVPAAPLKDVIESAGPGC
jgi:uncharacterized protein YceK